MASRCWGFSCGLGTATDWSALTSSVGVGKGPAASWADGNSDPFTAGDDCACDVSPLSEPFTTVFSTAAADDFPFTCKPPSDST